MKTLALGMGKKIFSEGQKREIEQIEIDVFHGKEIDLAPPVKTKKKTRREERYDYNDPFLEPLEGNISVLAECKYENFLIYKGEISTNIKALIRKYNTKKTENKNEQKNNLEDIKIAKKFIFEDTEEIIVNALPKQKKDIKLENYFIMWLFMLMKENRRYSMEIRSGLENTNKIEKEIIKEYSKNNEKEIPGEFPNTNEENTSENSLYSVILEKYKELKEMVSEEKNYSEGKKQFLNYRDTKLMDLLVDFISLYLTYKLYMERRANIMKALMDISIYFMELFPIVCQNKAKFKYYMIKHMEKYFLKSGYDLNDIAAGNFTDVVKGQKERHTGTKLGSEIVYSQEDRNIENVRFNDDTLSNPEERHSNIVGNNTPNDNKRFCLDYNNNLNSWNNIYKLNKIQTGNAYNIYRNEHYKNYDVYYNCGNNDNDNREFGYAEEKYRGYEHDGNLNNFRTIEPEGIIIKYNDPLLNVNNNKDREGVAMTESNEIKDQTVKKRDKKNYN